MRSMFRIFLLSLTLLVIFSFHLAHAETVELVTYYPTTANSGDEHFRSITVGNDYLNTTLANGQALIQTSLGIGAGFDAVAPAGALDVAGDLFVRRVGSNDYVQIRAESDSNTGIELRSGTSNGNPYIDFANDLGTDFDMRIQLNGNDSLSVVGGNLGVGTLTPGQTLSVAGSLGILEGGASPSDYTIFQGSAQTGDITYTLPAAQGAAGTVLANNGSGGLSWSPLTGAGIPNTVVVFNASGNWTAPAGVTRIDVEVWGGGGGGGGACNNTGYGNGGGGGGYARSILAVTPGTTYTVTVGVGGTGGNGGSGSNDDSPGTAGGTSFFNTVGTVSATGGAGGLADGDSSGILANTAGGVGTGGITISGEPAGNFGYSPSRGGNAPRGGFGGIGGQNVATSPAGRGTAGTAPGGGGGAGGHLGANATGGNGAAGRVVIKY